MKDQKADIKILLLGIGNSGRSDDGLGWKFVEMMEDAESKFYDVEYRYQLQVEDAELIAGYDIVVFADASYDKYEEGYQLQICNPDEAVAFSSHAQSAGAIVYLANKLYQQYPEAFTVAITGTEWGLGNSLSNEAVHNLENAVKFFKEIFLADMISTTLKQYN